MAVPATQGKQCKYLEEMEIGDYIRCTYTATEGNVAGEFSDLGGFVDTYETQQQQVDSEGNPVMDADGNPVMETVAKQYEELPTTPGSTANGSFYFLKVDKGLLVADRRLQAVISASSLNQKNYFSGGYWQQGLLRILTVDEWAKYITNGTCEGKTSLRDPAVWNIQAAHATYQEIGYYGFTIYTELVQYLSSVTTKTEYSMNRATYDGSNFLRWWYLNPAHSTYVSAYAGFAATTNPYSRATSSSRGCTPFICYRPAFEYIDNPYSKTIYF